MDESEVKYRRLADTAEKSMRNWSMMTTRFLDPSEVSIAAHAAKEAGCEYTLYGGYEGAERVVCIYAPDKALAETKNALTRIRISWNEKYSSVTHRDILGALMGLGIERECTGDIIPENGSAVIFVTNEIADWITDQLETCGRAHVKCIVENGEYAAPPPEGIVKRVTVASLRLDSFVSEALNISRSRSCDLIKSGMVKKQFAECLKTDAPVNEGDLVSVRSFGRIRLEEVEGQTKKGRIGIRIFYYATTKKA